MEILERFEPTKIESRSHRFKQGRGHGCDGRACGREKTHPIYDNILHETDKRLDVNLLDDHLVSKKLEPYDF